MNYSVNYTIEYLPPLQSKKWHRLKTPEKYGFTSQVNCRFMIQPK
jgi:hypothetical protein